MRNLIVAGEDYPRPPILGAQEYNLWQKDLKRKTLPGWLTSFILRLTTANINTNQSPTSMRFPQLATAHISRLWISTMPVFLFYFLHCFSTLA